jgi:hypothetical protein
MKKPHVDWASFAEMLVFLVAFVGGCSLLAAAIVVPGVLWFGPWWTIGTAAIVFVAVIVLANTEWR